VSARDESAELAAVVARKGALPMPVAPEPQVPAEGYPASLPWAALMDDEDLLDFLDELTDAATRNVSCVERLAEVERACSTWRLIAEAQHGHNTAPGPDAMTQTFVPVASLREPEPEPEFHAFLYHPYTKPHDLPETGAPRVAVREADDPARCLRVHPFSPRDGWRMVCGNCDHGKDAECHQVGA
jgi:hypothetical protein